MNRPAQWSITLWHYTNQCCGETCERAVKSHFTGSTLSYTHSSIYHVPTLEANGNYIINNSWLQWSCDCSHTSWFARTYKQLHYVLKNKQCCHLTWQPTTVHNVGVEYVGVWCILHGTRQLWHPLCFHYLQQQINIIHTPCVRCSHIDVYWKMRTKRSLSLWPILSYVLYMCTYQCYWEYGMYITV